MLPDRRFLMTAKIKLNRNDWGYSIGGPIIKNKLFFFWSQEWNHNISRLYADGMRAVGGRSLRATSPRRKLRLCERSREPPNIPVANAGSRQSVQIANPIRQHYCWCRNTPSESAHDQRQQLVGFASLAG